MLQTISLILSHPKMNNVSGTCKHFAGVFLIISWRKISALVEQKIPPGMLLFVIKEMKDCCYEIKWNEKYSLWYLWVVWIFVINQYCGFLMLHKVKKFS